MVGELANFKLYWYTTKTNLKFGLILSGTQKPDFAVVIKLCFHWVYIVFKKGGLASVPILQLKVT